MMRKVVGLAGSVTVPSRTRALVERAVDLAAARFGARGTTYDLRDLMPSLGQAQSLHDLAPEARGVVLALLDADALVVGSPVYKGSYTGLFKHLFDLFDPAALIGKQVLLTATGGGDKHALVIEHQLRPLFGFFEARTLPLGIYASNADFVDGVPASPVLLARLERAVEQFTPGPLLVRPGAGPERRLPEAANN